MKNNIKIFYILLCMLLIIPTILGLNHFIKENFNQMIKGVNPDMFLSYHMLIILLIGIISLYLAKNQEKYFKETKDIIIYIVNFKHNFTIFN